MLANRPIVGEAFGLTDDENPYVNLSDGGHFENLGLYEMVRRRCSFILVSDAGQDSTFAFEDLGNAIRKIYIDLHIRITFNHSILIYERPGKGEQPRKGTYFATAVIHYEEVDKLPSGKPPKPGRLIYVKPTLYGAEPADVFNYGRMSTAFPHESTANQFFTESQFESYRALGFHIIDSIYEDQNFKGAKSGDIAELIARVDATVDAAADLAATSGGGA